MNRFSDRPELSRLAVMGRLMDCQQCGATIDVIEIPYDTIDPDHYVCCACEFGSVRERHAHLEEAG